MADWETTKIKADVKSDAAELDETYTEIMQAGINSIQGEPPAPERNTGDVNADELAARIVDAVGATAGGPQVDDSEIAREVARQLDYTAIADKVSEQVVREMRG